MKTRLLLPLLAATALAVPAAAAPGQQPAGTAAQRDWTGTVEMTPEGGYRMGNPDAPVKVVEFVSLTCPHCAHFAEEGVPPLIENYIRTGRVSLEYRNFVLNPFDAAAAVISRCAAPEDYFALSDAILRAQPEWTGRIQSLSVEQRTELSGLPVTEVLHRIAMLAGLDRIAARHDVTAEEAQACFADAGRLDRLGQMAAAASNDLGVTGTPSFAVNGRLAEGVHDWAGLEPLLRPPGR